MVEQQADIVVIITFLEDILSPAGHIRIGSTAVLHADDDAEVFTGGGTHLRHLQDGTVMIGCSRDRTDGARGGIGR